MQFENKPHTKDALPVKFTTIEAVWLDHQGLGAKAKAEDKTAYRALRRKLMQARRDAVGDRLPADVAALPLIPQDMPDYDPSTRAGLGWLLTMGKLVAIENEAHSDDKLAPHTVTTELTAQEIDLISTVACKELRDENSYDFEITAEDRAIFEKFGYSVEPWKDPSDPVVASFSMELEHKAIAAGIMHAIFDYRQESPA